MAWMGPSQGGRPWGAARFAQGGSLGEIFDTEAWENAWRQRYNTISSGVNRESIWAPTGMEKVVGDLNNRFMRAGLSGRVANRWNKYKATRVSNIAATRTWRAAINARKEIGWPKAPRIPGTGFIKKGWQGLRNFNAQANFMKKPAGWGEYVNAAKLARAKEVSNIVGISTGGGITGTAAKVSGTGFKTMFNNIVRSPMNRAGVFGSIAIGSGLMFGVGKGIFKEVPKLLQEDLAIMGMGTSARALAKEQFKRSISGHPKNMGASGSMVFGMYNTRHGGQPSVV
jgi:hypothetical protein